MSASQWAEGARESRPWTRAARARPPAPLSSLIGREDEVRALVEQLARGRLVTLTGAGGCGKTRLALAAAASSDRDAVWLDLLALPRGANMGAALASVFGVRRAEAARLVDAVAASVAGEDVLLLADNAEHLVVELAEALGALLPRCPRLTALVTSREPLGMSGEVVWVVPPLVVPPLDVPPGALRDYPAARCFLERATAAQGPTAAECRSLTAPRAASIARLCRVLDGIPLALELAAARTPTLSVAQLEERLGDALRLLTVGPRDAPPRHRTLRATLDWSYGLLPTPQRRLLRHLAVFAGSFTLTAVEGVCADHPGSDADLLDTLSGLVARSMVIVISDASDSAASEGRRLRLLETVRQYAREQLAAAGEVGQAERAHASYYLTVMRDGDRRLRAPTGGGSSERHALLAALAADQDDVQAALAWAWASGGGASDPARGRYLVELAAACWWFWWLHGDFLSGLTWLRRALAVLGEHGGEPDASWCAPRSRAERAGAPWSRAELALRAEVWHGLGWLARHQGEPDEARRWLTAASKAYAALDDAAGESVVLHRLAAVAMDRGDHSAAARLLERSLLRARFAAEPWVLGAALYWEGVRRATGPSTTAPVTPGSDAAGGTAGRSTVGPSSAGARTAGPSATGPAGQRTTDRELAGVELLRSAAGLFERCGDPWAVGRARGMLARALARAGQPRAAAAALAEARVISDAAGDRWGLASWSLCEAEIYLSHREYRSAAASLAAALAAFTALGDRQRVAEALCVGAQVAAEAGQPEAARRLRSAAQDVAGTESTDGSEGIGGSEGSEGTDCIAGSEGVAGSEGTDCVAGSEGTDCFARSEDSCGGAAVAIAALSSVLATLAEEPDPSQAPRPGGLTQREVEVLTLVGEGLSDEAIASRLFLSPRTVGGHLASAYRKLGVHSRTAALRRATRLGLLDKPATRDIR